ncbi:Cu2+-exporting P-type ATPase [Galdieria sulphuraria]|uniref:Cu2+-exporting P-type ATPase n=1 Tax=Galdieria sulphuraria TaxID=130081 RepID=M2X397_GALSU|nr:Cu2+-exporting P-type ATPase [Galdieria sulphuraria]EME30850.1 Cu2+-exporting P-type ATPase [Galdieria sulphuraria]|eukprot:XP_005707370.1 Cu2+-exporting P-type ATPase [Galdieria sulphuraria]
MSGWNLQVQGMTCSSCAKNIQNALYKEEEVSNVSVNVLLGSVLVQGRCSKEQITNDVEAIGFKVVSCTPLKDDCDDVESSDQTKLTICTKDKEDTGRRLIRVKTGVASAAEYIQQVPTTELVLRWNNIKAAELCADFLKKLKFVQHVSISSLSDLEKASVTQSYCSNILRSWKIFFASKQVPTESVFFVTAVIYDFRNFYPEAYLKEQFTHWQTLMNEMGTSNTKAAIYAYLSSHLTELSWQTDCKVDVSADGNKMMESVTNALNCVYDEGKKWRDRFLWCTLCSIPLLLLVLVNPSSLLLLQIVLATFVQCYGGYPFYRAAFHVMKHSMRANMAVLITTSSLIAYIYSLFLCFQRWFLEQSTDSRLFMPMFETGAMLITVVLFGKWMESTLKMRASRELEKIGELLPSKVHIVLHKEPIEIFDFSNSSLLQVESSIIEPGDIIRVETGLAIPVDGKIVSGSSFVDESFLTGEPCTIQKTVNDTVYAGAINISHPLFIQATSVGSKTSMEEILRLWNETQLSKAPTEPIADKISAIFVPSVLLLSLGVFLCWWICLQYSIVPMNWWVNDGKFLFCLYFCLSAMVIACPCALGLAAPMAYMIASFTALKHGIVYRDISTLIAFIEDIENIVFDKTGTLTLGRPVVTQCHGLSCTLMNGYDENFSQRIVWRIVDELESQCVHPIAKAVTDYARQCIDNNEELSLFTLSSVKEQPGIGMEAEFQCTSDDQWHSIMIGQKDWLLTRCTEARVLDQCHVLKEALIRLEQLHSKVENETLVLVAINHIPIWLLLVEDAIRPEAHLAIQWLQNNLGLHCWLLSGDNYKSARHVANVVGIQERYVMAKLQPWQKWQWIQSKMAEQREANCSEKRKVGRIVFVGDGLNDAPALAQADIGMAMGNSNPISHQTASVVLKRNDLRDIITALDLAKRLKKTIYWNYAWAMLYNLLAFPLAAGLLYPLWRIRIPPFLAAAAMGFSSISVMLSSLRLKNYKPPNQSLAETDDDIEMQPRIETWENEATSHLMG